MQKVGDEFVYLCIPICVFECVCLCIFQLCEDELLCAGFMQRVNCGLMFLEILATHSFFANGS